MDTILKRMIEVGFTFSKEKSSFGLHEVLELHQEAGSFAKDEMV